MSRRRGAVIIVVVAALFLLANRAAYKGYFSGDDLAAIELMRETSFVDWLNALVSPYFNADNFRPVGYALFAALDRVAGLQFPAFLAAAQILHGLVTLSIYGLARCLGASTRAATVGSLFFVFHMALFATFWQFLYIFDTLCALFLILGTLAWIRPSPGWSFVSFLCFLLAFRSKEVAIFFPVFLALWEWQRRRESKPRWLLLVAFFGVSAWFGAQSLLQNHLGTYHREISISALATTVPFYASHLLVKLWLLPLLVAVIVLARRRLPLAAAALLLAPMLLLPGRLAPAYLYAPLAFFSVVVASAAERSPLIAFAALVPWLALNFVDMRRLRSDALAEASDRRAYVSQVFDRARELNWNMIDYDGYPPSLGPWGARGAVELATGRKSNGRVQALSWQPGEKRVYFFTNEFFRYLDMSTGTFLFYSEGWYEPEATFRWTAPNAIVALERPDRPSMIVLKTFVPTQQWEASGGQVTTKVSIDGGPSSTLVVTTPGEHELIAPAIVGTQGDGLLFVRVSLETTPPFRPDPIGRTLGVAVEAIGFR